MKQKKYMRYHRFDQNNVKIIKQFELTETPETINENGFTKWTRGTGKLNEQAYNNLVTGVRKACLGVPKSQSCKEKMSNSHKGKKKSLEHRQNMSLGHQKKKKIDAQEKNLLQTK